MRGWLKNLGAARRARREYEMRLLESLMAENARRLDELDRLSECPWCLAMESPQQRDRCDVQFCDLDICATPSAAADQV